MLNGIFCKNCHFCDFLYVTFASCEIILLYKIIYKISETPVHVYKTRFLFYIISLKNLSVVYSIDSAIKNIIFNVKQNMFFHF